MRTYFIESKSFKVIFTSILAFLAGYTFDRLGVYLPWMLGPLFVVMIAKVKLRKYMFWAKPFRSIGLVILGLQLGSAFTKQSLNEMVEYLPVMLFTTIAIIFFNGDRMVCGETDEPIAKHFHAWQFSRRTFPNGGFK